MRGFRKQTPLKSRNRTRETETTDSQGALETHQQRTTSAGGDRQFPSCRQLRGERLLGADGLRQFVQYSVDPGFYGSVFRSSADEGNCAVMFVQQDIQRWLLNGAGM